MKGLFCSIFKTEPVACYGRLKPSRQHWPRWLLLACLVFVQSTAAIHLAKHSLNGEVNCPVCVLGHADGLVDSATSVRFMPPLAEAPPSLPRFFLLSYRHRAFSSRAPPASLI